MRRLLKKMLINRLLFPINSLGPGNRLIIYTQFCNRQCFNCASPELQPFDLSKQVSVDELYKTIIQNIDISKLDGITITGGEPLQQPIEELLHLLELLNTITSDIILYTGYEYSEIPNFLHEEQLFRLKQNISLLIDGPYIDSLNKDDLTLRGSTNQNLIFMKPYYKERYHYYLQEGRKIQNVAYGNENSFISVGIHSKDKGGV